MKCYVVSIKHYQRKVVGYEMTTVCKYMMNMEIFLCGFSNQCSIVSWWAAVQGNVEIFLGAEKNLKLTLDCNQLCNAVVTYGKLI